MLLSIIIPTLNESVLEKTLSNLQSSLTLPHEIIVTDGKSTDRTVEIARRYGAKVFEHDGSHRQTIAEGRNAGAALATGDFVVFIDADCLIFQPDAFFTKLLGNFAQDPKLVARNVAIRVLPEMQTWSDRLVYVLFNDYLWIMNNFLHIGISAGEFQMIRKSVFDQIGGYNPKLVASEDVDLFSRLSKIGRVRFEKELTIYHTGRRAHKIGWPRLLWLWNVNAISMTLRKRAHSKEWEPIR